MSRKVMRGWRFFECEDCGSKWKESCRDYATPSSSVCPNDKCEGRYQGGVTPHDGIADETLSTDGYGNLGEPTRIIWIEKPEAKLLEGV